MVENIYIRVWGGIGNQLFIYAFARYISLNWDGKVGLEIYSGFRGDNYHRIYKLDRFSITLPKSNFLSSFFFSFNRKYPLLKRLIFPSSRLIIENEDQLIFDVCQFIPPSNQREKTLYYQGYWQHINFSSIREILLSELRFNLPPNSVFEEIKAKIQASEAVCLHVRRMQYSRLLTLDYYRAAVSILEKSCTAPCFFIFSDDLAWCRERLSISYSCVYIDNFDDELYELQLMSFCHHFIIANSSFSWWGAWLSQHPDKMVILPEDYLVSNMDGRVIPIHSKELY
jgi:hypothetical protein